MSKTKIYMEAKIDVKGNAKAVVHGTDESKEAGFKLIVLFALLLKSLEKKTGYDANVICTVANNYLNGLYPEHSLGCIKEIDTGW